VISLKRLKIILMLCLCCAVCETAPSQASDPLGVLKQFSDFSKIDIKRLLEGEILTQRGPLMNFPNGISSQLLFAVPTSPAETVKRLQSWDPTRCSSLKVYASHDLNDPSEPKQFNSLYRYLDPGNRPIRWLWDQTLATTDHSSDLNLTQIEALELTRCIGKDANAKTIGACWGNLLFARASGFQRNGFNSSLHYEFDVESVNPTSHIRSLLQEQTQISREFGPLLQRVGLVEGGTVTSPIRPSYYWRLFQADHRATLSLGAVYAQQVGDHYQLLDIEYYVSGTYYTSATLYEIWPIQDGGRTGSLVWCNVLCSAPMLRFAAGIERLASGVILNLEFKKCIRCFQDSIKTQ
jgi:hypothetical protein